MGTERDKTKTAYYILNNYVKNKDPRNHIFILHRLDKETSGVMMFAKNKKVQEILQKNWNEMIRERKYVAVIEGCPQPEQGQVKSYIPLPETPNTGPRKTPCTAWPYTLSSSLLSIPSREKK